MARYLRSTFDPSATAALPRIGRSTAANSGLAATVAGICIAYWLVAIGFVLCCINPTTWLLSTLTDASESSPYTSAQLTELAQQTRAYTVEGESADALYAAIGAQAKTLTDAQITAITGKSTALSGLDDAAAGRTLCRIIGAPVAYR